MQKSHKPDQVSESDGSAINNNLRGNSRQDSESKNFEELEHSQYLCKVLGDTGAGSKNF